MWKKLSRAKLQKNGRLPCKSNTILLLSTTLGHWCHFPKVGSSFLTNGSSKSSMVLMMKLKVKLMARGFTWTFGVNYNKTFAPITKFVSIHCILAFVAIEDMEIHQMNIKTTFSMVTLKQPQGFTQERGEHLVCGFHKSLYGLKQSPKAWNQKLDAFLKRIKFMRSDVDFNVYIV